MIQRGGTALVLSRRAGASTVRYNGPLGFPHSRGVRLRPCGPATARDFCGRGRVRGSRLLREGG